MNKQNNCTNYREAIAALVLGILEPEDKENTQKHLETCPNCKELYQAMLNEEKNIRSSFHEIAQKGDTIQSSLIEKLDKNEAVTPQPPKSIKINPGKFSKSPLIKFAAAFLIISSLVANFVLSRKNADLRDELGHVRQDIHTTSIDDSVTINLYLKEHQDFIARQASHDSAASQPIQMYIDLNDIMYYEFLDDDLEFLNSGMIVRGPSSQQEIESNESPTISNGHTLTTSEAQEATDFDIVSPSWFHPCYKLSQLRIIEGRDSLQLLYTNGINSISLFEQPLDGQNGLSHRDFREYAVYNNQGEGGGTILAWRDDTLSYVLIGNIELSMLMDMAQTISAGK